MSKLISLKINVSKLDKTRFFKGKKGVYADLTLSLNDVQDDYGNSCSIWQQQTQEERKANVDRNFVGNGKIIWQDDAAPNNSAAAQNAGGVQPAQQDDFDDEDIPF